MMDIHLKKLQDKNCERNTTHCQEVRESKDPDAEMTKNNQVRTLNNDNNYVKGSTGKGRWTTCIYRWET